MQNSKFKIQNGLAAFCIFSFAFLIPSCGVPNLESPGCSAARSVAKQFYSLHFGNDMKPTNENLRARQRFLTPRYAKALEQWSGDLDPFTLTLEYPRTFKIGECRETDPEQIEMQVQLYWRDDQKTVQQEIVADLVKQDGIWLLDGVGTKGRQ